MTRSSKFGAALWIGLMAVACSEAVEVQGQIVLLVDSDYDVPGDLDQVRIRVEDVERTVDVDELPLSVGIRPGDGDLSRPVTIEVTGLGDGRQVVRTGRVLERLAPGLRLLPVFLPRNCACEGDEVCYEVGPPDDDNCRPPDVDAEDLTELQFEGQEIAEYVRPGTVQCQDRTLTRWVEMAQPPQTRTCEMGQVCSEAAETCVDPQNLNRVTVTVEGMGRVTGSMGGIDCPGRCSATVPEGTRIELEVAGGSERFRGWSGPCLDEGPPERCVVQVGGDVDVTADFGRTPGMVELTVNNFGPAPGRIQVDGPPGGPAERCDGRQCTYLFDAGDTVELRAEPGPEVRFVEWAYAGCEPQSSTCTVTLNDDAWLGARFTWDGGTARTLTVDVEGPGGVVVLGPVFDVCDFSIAPCEYDVPPGAPVEMFPAPFFLPGSAPEFAGYEGACAGRGQCRFVVDGDVTVSARFSPSTLDSLVSVLLSGTGRGRVLSSDNRIDCGAETGSICAATYAAEPGTSLVLRAQPDPGSRFDGWVFAPPACLPLDPVCTLEQFELSSFPDVEARFEPDRVGRLDLDGDGRSDLTFAAPGASPGPMDSRRVEAGRMYIRRSEDASDYLTPRSLQAGDSTIMVSGDAPGDRFGSVIVPMGDLNGDGTPDYAVSAPGRQGFGSVYVLYGDRLSGMSRPTPAPNQVLRIDGDVAGLAFGTSMSALTDLSGDGRPELVVGAPGNDARPGRVYVFVSESLGGSQATLSAEEAFAEIEGVFPGGRFGAAVSGAGDLDGDGLIDLVVGEPRALLEGRHGRVYVFLGRRPLPPWRSGLDADAIVSGPDDGPGFGARLERAGRWLDPQLRFEDLLVAAPGQNYVYFMEGAPAYGLYWDGWISDLSDQGAVGAGSVNGPIDMEGDLGLGMAGGHDFDGDGLVEWLVGAPDWRPEGGAGTGEDLGQVFILWNPSFGVFEPNLTINEPGCPEADCAGFRFGRTIAPVGDLNGDGFVDLAVGADWSGQVARQGRIHVYVASSGNGLPPQNFPRPLGLEPVVEGEAYPDGQSYVLPQNW